MLGREIKAWIRNAVNKGSRGPELGELGGWVIKQGPRDT